MQSAKDLKDQLVAEITQAFFLDRLRAYTGTAHPEALTFDDLAIDTAARTVSLGGPGT